MFIPFFLSCEILSVASLLVNLDSETDLQLSEKASGHFLYDPDLSDIYTFKDVAEYIQGEIFYFPDMIDSIDNPEEVLTRGYGDCDDYALLFMNIAYFELGVKFDLASVYVNSTDTRMIVNGGFVNHAMVSLNGILYSAYTGEVVEDNEISYLCFFDFVFSGSI